MPKWTAEQMREELWAIYKASGADPDGTYRLRGLSAFWGLEPSAGAGNAWSTFEGWKGAQCGQKKAPRRPGRPTEALYCRSAMNDFREH